MSRTGEAQRPSNAVRWALGVGAAVMVAIGLVLLFLLTLTTNNRVLYERNYAWLFGINVVVAAFWQPPVGQAGCYFCPGRAGAGADDLLCLLPVCVALHRKLV